jgi:hypothetical protein
MVLINRVHFIITPILLHYKYLFYSTDIIYFPRSNRKHFWPHHNDSGHLNNRLFHLNYSIPQFH